MNAHDIRQRYAEQLSWPDERLVAWAASVVAVPKEAPPSSFVLHAPLELMARAVLLRMVEGSSKQRARERLAWMTDLYAAAGEEVSEPRPVSHAAVADGLSALADAVGDSDLERVDAHASWLGQHASASQLRAGLAPLVGPSLAAAGHGGIALHLLSHVPESGPLLIRGLARELARHPDWTISWEGLLTGDRQLLDALLDTPLLGAAEASSIRPMVLHGTEVARKLLADVAGTAADTAGRDLSRVAAWSMLQDAAEEMPYGWTHALTIPQGVMSLPLDPVQRAAIAGVQLIGFRASMGTVDLDPAAPAPPVPAGIAASLASKASSHFDAHLVKYTLACFDAARSDEEMADLYLAAAARLHGYWDEQPDDGFFAA